MGVIHQGGGGVCVTVWNQARSMYLGQDMSFSTEIWRSSCFYGELCEESVSELPKLPLTADFCLLYLAHFVILKSFSKEGKRFGKGRVEK